MLLMNGSINSVFQVNQLQRRLIMDKDKFQYFLEFVQMRMQDNDFAQMYKANQFELWYSDFMEVLSQKYWEPANEE